MRIFQVEMACIGEKCDHYIFLVLTTALYNKHRPSKYQNFPSYTELPQEQEGYNYPTVTCNQGIVIK